MATAWPRAEPIATSRLALVPLTVDHAWDMVPVLAATDLYTFTGGHPPDLGELARRYERLVAGHSPDGAEGWLNWVVTTGGAGNPVGTVQATLRHTPPHVVADIAWVVALVHQRRGYATEAAAAMVGWLREHGPSVFHAYIHPAHTASARVAERLGMAPTDVLHDGERRWALSRSPAAE